jgi:hypothetical protein
VSASGLRVARSPIHGHGLIAERAFADGDVLTDVHGTLCRGAERTDGDDHYTLWIDDDWYLEISDDARWINHSCEPNVWIDAGFRSDGTPWAHVIALRAIEPGEELTCDYAFPVTQAEPCACGAPQCRQLIVDEAYAPETTTDREQAAPGPGQ